MGGDGLSNCGAHTVFPWLPQGEGKGVSILGVGVQHHLQPSLAPIFPSCPILSGRSGSSKSQVKVKRPHRNECTLYVPRAQPSTQIVPSAGPWGEGGPQ